MPAFPLGISSMTPIETSNATQPIPYSNNDALHCSLIGCKEAVVSSPRSMIEQCGLSVGFAWDGGDVVSGLNRTNGSHGDNGHAQCKGAL